MAIRNIDFSQGFHQRSTMSWHEKQPFHFICQFECALCSLETNQSGAEMSKVKIYHVNEAVTMWFALLVYQYRKHFTHEKEESFVAGEEIGQSKVQLLSRVQNMHGAFGLNPQGINQDFRLCQQKRHL